MATRPSSMFDQQALVTMLAEASAKQSEQVRKAVHDATLQALQGRELTLQNIRSALKSVAQATTMGAAKNPLAGGDGEALLQSAVQGMDDALLRAVEAYRVGASRLIEQGVGMQDQVLQKALDAVEKMEDALFKAANQGAQAAGGSMGKQWSAVLGQMQMGGTGTGAQASQTVDQLGAQMQQALQQSRAAGVQAATLFAQSWGALVSGVLMGMSDAMKQGAATRTSSTKTKR